MPEGRVAGGTARLLEDPGKIVVKEPEKPRCAESTTSDLLVETPQGLLTLVIDESFDLPPFADRATIFLSGWSMRYLEDDHHVRTISAAIRNIELVGSALKWQAVGLMVDDGNDDDFEFCYTYTLLAWNSMFIDAVVDHDDPPGTDDVTMGFFNGKFRESEVTGSSLTAISSYSLVPLSSRPPEPREAVAILPRGFLFDFEEDHHLQQLAYHLGHNDAFLEKDNDYDALEPPDSVANGSLVTPFSTSWQTRGIIKDRNVSRNYRFLSQPSILVGDDISVVRPPATVIPIIRTSEQGLFETLFDIDFLCEDAIGPEGIQREVYEIRGIPFEYATPVLTGWDLAYPCEDEEVTQIGIWLEDVEYKKQSDEGKGVLRYTLASVLRDKDFFPTHLRRYKVDILGLNSTEPSDLAPLPHGEEVDFCRRDAEGLLLIDIANTADGAAPASTTVLTFDPGPELELATPEIPANFSGTLQPVELPPECTGGCLFTVIADAFESVTELDEDNNRTSGRCAG